MSFLASGKCARTSSSRLTVSLSSQPLCFPHPEAAQFCSVWPLAWMHDAEAFATRVLKVRLALKLELEADERRQVGRPSNVSWMFTEPFPALSFEP